MDFLTKTAAICGLSLAALLTPKSAEALTVSFVGTTGGGLNEYQIDFDPITFVSNSFSSSGVGFIVKDFFNTAPGEFGVATSGDLTVDTTLTNGNPSNPTLATPSPGGQRGTLGPTTGFDESDLFISTGGLLFSFGGPRFNDPTDVTISSATGLNFTTVNALPDFDFGDYDAFLVDNAGRELSDAVTITAANDNVTPPNVIPLPPSMALGALGIAAFGFLKRRKDHAARA